MNDEDPLDPAPLAESVPASLPSVAREDEPSITGIHGTGARFEMAYSQRPVAHNARVAYGPPASQRWPSIAYCIFTLVVLGVVAVAYSSGSNSRLYIWVIDGDRGRPLPAWLLSIIIFASGIGTVLRAHMRGVVVSSNGIEARYLMALGVPRIKHWTWPQMDRFIIDSKRVMVELWDGKRERLPEVAEFGRLVAHLESIAVLRKKEVTRLGDLPRTEP